MQEFLSRLQQLLSLRIDVPLIRQSAEGIEYSTSAAVRVILLIAEFFSDRVCGLEADSPDVIGKTVRVVLDFPDAFLAILLVNLGGIGGADSMALAGIP